MANAQTAGEAPRQTFTLVWQLAVLVAVLTLAAATTSPATLMPDSLLAKLFYLIRFAALLLLATWFLHMRGLSWADVGLRRPRSWLRFALALPLGYVATVAAVFAVKTQLARAGLQDADYSMFAPIRGNLGLYLFFVLPVSWGTAAFGEEMLLRGFALDAISRLLGGPGSRFVAPLAVVLQAAVFGLLHLYQGPGGAAVAGTIGLMFGLVWLFSGRNLWAGVILHGLFDSMSMTVIYLGLPHG